jgi:hypothetical protein
MTDDRDLKGSLERLVRSAEAALRAPVGDVAWEELVRVIMGEKAILDTPLDVEVMNGVLSRVIADAECVSASFVATRCRGARSAVVAERHLVNYCQNMKSGIETLLSDLQSQKAQRIDAPIREPLRQIR